MKQVRLFFPNDRSNHLKLMTWSALGKIYFDLLITFMNHYMHGSLAEYYNQRCVEYHAVGNQVHGESRCHTVWIHYPYLNGWKKTPVLTLLYCHMFSVLLSSCWLTANLSLCPAYHKCSHWVIALLFNLFWMWKGLNWHLYTFYH